MTLQAELEQLERAQLVRRAALGLAAQAPSEVEYLFKHVLVQELSYESLLRQDRKNLHFLVASALERDPAFRSDEAAAILARHWDQAGEPARAVNYYIRAGDAAARVYANAEALMAYDRAVELAASLELDSDQAQHLYVQRGRSLELQGSYDAALANYLELATWARAQQALGDHAAAAAARQEGRAVAEFVAEHAPPDLRERFLNRPQVRALMQ